MDLDFSDVRGNDLAIDALTQAAAHRTGVILMGPPGSGRTMIARRAPGLLAPLADREAAWLAAEYSNGLDCYGPGATPGGPDRAARWHGDRPFRAPHHTVSASAMSGAIQRKHRIACPEVRGYLDRMGIWHGLEPYRCQCDKLGGKESIFRPGECHLARFGVLFLDELIEFPRSVVESIAYTIASMSPATRPWLIATGTHCPCGWYGSAARECGCSVSMIDRWRDRLSWSLRKLEIGESIKVEPVDLAKLRAAPAGRSTSELRERVIALGGAA